MKQKYPSAYYCFIKTNGGTREHYMMFKGIRTRHNSKEEVIAQCDKVNKQYNLPNVTQ